MKDILFREPMSMPDEFFPVKISYLDLKDLGGRFYRHWHEHIEILYFLQGRGIIECENNKIIVSKEDLIVINGNQIHAGEIISKSLKYYCIIVDMRLLQNHFIGNLETKYIIPIRNNQILFKNKIEKDQELLTNIKTIINEYNTKEDGYELSIVSHLYQVIAILYRKYIEKILTEHKYKSRKKTLTNFSNVLQYISENYEKSIDIGYLANMSYVSTSHFYSTFKEITGKTPSNYINFVRVDKAENLLRNSGMNVTETAFAVGFNDLSYFCRLFKKYKGFCPSTIKKE